VFRILKINPNLIIFESEGDLSDNSYALYDYIRNVPQYKKYKLVWLVDDLKAARNLHEKNIRLIRKRAPFVDFVRDYYLATCKWFVCDHCNILGQYHVRPEQTIVNLFHGCGFKKVKGVASKAANTESMVLVTSDFWKKKLSDFVMCDESKVIALGYPRNDYLFRKSKEVKGWIESKGWSRYKKICFWMPTFRSSTVVDLSENYYEGETGLPILEKIDDLNQLDAYLKDRNVLMIFKVHHLQSQYPAFKQKYLNVYILHDEEIAKSSLQLYQVISIANFLITDYSSVSNDFLLLNRPMIFTLDDYEQYRKARGFSIDDPAQYFPGFHVVNREEFLSAIGNVIDGNDPFECDRLEMMRLMHKYIDDNSCKRVSEYMGL